MALPLLALAGLTVATSIFSAGSSARSAAAQAGAIGRYEGEQITRERQNTTLRNAFNAAAAQAALGLEKAKAARDLHTIGTGGLVASATADLQAASTGTAGASAKAVSTDISQKVGAAQQQVQDAFEQSLENYNASLQEIVLNTAQTETTPRKVENVGPSSGSILAQGLIAGAVQFGSSYFMSQAKLGLGTQQSSLTGTGLRIPSAGSSGLGLRL